MNFLLLHPFLALGVPNPPHYLPHTPRPPAPTVSIPTSLAFLSPYSGG